MITLSRAVLYVLAVNYVGIVHGQENGGGIETTNVTQPNTDVCGKRGGRFKRVVGGSDAEPGMFPWLAALGYKSLDVFEYTLSFECTGSLVTDRHLITAAQCHSKYISSGRIVSVARLGVFEIEHYNATRRETDYEVRSFTEHPKFNASTSENDIAIIRLKDKVALSSRIQTICLPILDEIRMKNFRGSVAYIAGWGRRNITDQQETRLQQAQVRVRSLEECMAAYKSRTDALTHSFNNKVVCAVGDDGSDTCRGDAGAPLMIPYGPDPYYYLYGISSFGSLCGGDVRSPRVYTRVSEFVAWILQNV